MLAVIVLAISLIVPIGAASENEYTEETVNHLRYDKICDILGVSGTILNSSIGSYYFTDCKNGTIVGDDIFADNICDFECGSLIDFMPTIKANVSYTFYMGNGYLYLGERQLSGLCFFTSDELSMPVYWRGVAFNFDIFYEGICIDIDFPIVVQGEFDTASLSSETWRPFYDTVTLKELTVWDKYPTLNMIPFPYASASGIYGGVTVVVNDDGTLLLNGTCEVTYDTGFEEFVLYEGEPIILPDCVAISGNNTDYSAYIGMYFDDGTFGRLSSGRFGRSFNTNGRGLIKLTLRLINGETYNNMIIKPMLNAGDKAYPYQPYIGYYFNQQYSNGYNEGVSVGYVNGYNDGDETGYKNGYADGQSLGYSDGYTNGESAGYSNGYNLGYSAGEQSTVTRDFMDIVSEIAFAPYRAVSAMFDFEIFGINLAGAVFSFFTVVVILIIIGFIVKMVV